MVFCPDHADIQLLGGFVLPGNAHAISSPAQRVLALLAVHERSLSRDLVAFTLWPDASEDHAAASLRTALWALRKLPGDLVCTTSSGIALTMATTVDYRELTKVAHETEKAEQPIDPATRLRLYGCELLPGWYDDWLVIVREHWRAIRLDALDALARVAIADGQYLLAVEACLAAVSIEPLRETTRQLLIEAHLAEGNRAQAIKEYYSLRRSLRLELGVDPSPSLENLIALAGLRVIEVDARPWNLTVDAAS